jgi:DNA repair exonuclease SbcCD nuclease subunit
MLRILYLTDSHFGQTADDPWMLQPHSPQCFDAFYAALPQWLDQHQVDYVLHGGDAVSQPRPKDVARAAATFGSLGRPAYLCLGNHDLMSEHAAELWRADHNGLLPDGQFDYVVEHDDADLVVLAHHWYDLSRPYYWDRHRPMLPILADTQWKLLKRQAALSQQRSRPLLLALHSQVLGVGHTPYGSEDAGAAPPNPELLIRLRALARTHPCLKLVMSGHCHAHHILPVGSFHAMTTTAIGESPFEARLITIDRGSLVIETVCFRDVFQLHAPYNDLMAWAQGRPADRWREIDCNVEAE